MNRKLQNNLVAFGLISSSVSAQAALSVTPDLSAADLTDLILGDGITVSGAPVLDGNSSAAGAFGGGLSAGLGFDSGIIITSGDAVAAIGPNNSSSTTSGSGSTTALTFDFETDGGDLFFNYIFASEEYNEFVFSSFNDSFTFLLDGENIALIPGTTDPVEIDTVNNDVNSEFYIDNDADAGSPNDIEYDGFTVALTAQALGLSAGTHTIELRVSDVGDSAFDSAVFIQGGTFSDSQTPAVEATIPEPSSILGTGILIAGCLLTSRFRRS